MDYHSGVKKWDYDVPSVSIWAEALRVLKPGGYLLSFSGTRTYHRMVVAIEDAGFEVRDQIGWLYASGFPKSHNLKGEWEGWGTALKPAWEPVCMARKPFTGTVAANVAEHGTGALNVGACRVECEDAPAGRKRHGGGVAFADGASGFKQDAITVSPAGRWPANIIHDGSEEVLEEFEKFGERASGKANGGATKGEASKGAIPSIRRGSLISRDDSGTAARFFYSAKASKQDRAGSKHPTVKPVALMEYLCRLVTPPNGTILDPFAGSGTTGQAAVNCGFNAILIEREAEHCADIRNRLAAHIQKDGGV